MSPSTLHLILQPFLWNEGATSEGYLAAPHIGVLCWLGSMFVVAWSSHRILLSTKAALMAELDHQTP